MVNYDTTHSEVTHKYLLKAFYNKINKKEYDSQIRHHNVCNPNIIAMKDVIAMAERCEELLAMENVDKTAIAEIAKVSSAIDFKSKHS